VTDVLAFLSLERSLGSIAYGAMYPVVAPLAEGLARAVASERYSDARRLAGGISLEHAARAIMDGGPVVADAAFRLGASVVFGDLDKTPRDITDLLDPSLVDNILSVHARIVSDRAETFIDNAISAILSDLAIEKADDEDAAVQLIAKRPNKDLADRLNAAVDGNAKLMAGLSANLTVGRLIAYGFLKAARQEGIKKYTLWNPRDERTSAICMELTNPPGHQFYVAFGLAHAEKLLQETDPEKLKALAPFLTTGDAQRIHNERLATWQLEEQNILVPPFHPFCRTLIVKVGDKLDVDMPHGPIAIASPIVLPTPYVHAPPIPVGVTTPGGGLLFPPKPPPKPRAPRKPRAPKPVPPAIALPVESVVNPGQLRLPLGGVVETPPGTFVLKPFTDFQAEVAGLKITDNTPLEALGRATGINRSAGRLTVNGKQYFVKPVSDDASDVRAEVGAAQIGEMLGVNSFPTAYVGERVVMPFLSYPEAGKAPKAAIAAVKAMTPYEKTRWIFGEYIIGDTDKHRNNYVVDAAKNKIYSIDGGRAFNYNRESVFMNIAFNSNVDNSLYPTGTWNKAFKLDVSAIRANLQQKQAVIDTIKRLGLESYEGTWSTNGNALEGVEYRFNQIEQFLKDHPEPTFGQWQRLIQGY
jgi:hypothetical protein